MWTEIMSAKEGDEPIPLGVEAVHTQTDSALLTIFCTCTPKMVRRVRIERVIQWTSIRRQRG